ncbi:hypothetical protein [Picosynechococcus sp. NKBG042902]|uniref:hypothetical protein n=1 Tax=Picosynechococcus sp. NKBG042902 TaxID=490193 RepID=UPI0004AAEF13|nr:hypothetical protein [Picosynechococcus sp. NKBG042902]
MAEKTRRRLYNSSEAQLANLDGHKHRKIFADESKSVRWSVRLTPSGRSGLDEIAKENGLSASELIDRLGRGEFRLSKSA